MPNPALSANVALLIDADNATPSSIDPVLTVLAELGTVNIRRAYGNWSKPGLKGWADIIHRHGIEPQQQFDITKGKNATDMKMTIDAMDLLSSGRVTGFGIMSSDSDFMPLAVRIKQDGLPVYGFGSSKAPEPFQNACSRFIDTTALTATLASAPAEAAREAKRPIDTALRTLLGEAYEAVRHDEHGFATLSSLGQHASNRSSFDARNYGYKRLSDLIAAIPGFVVERREGGAVYVKRID